MDKRSILKRDLWMAKKRIASYISHTPFVYSHRLSRLTGAEVYLKFENMQEIGAFKIRGAANKILSLTPEEQAQFLAIVRKMYDNLEHTKKEEGSSQ